MKRLLIVLFSLFFIASASAQVGSNVIVGDDSSITRSGNLTSTPIALTNQDATPDVSGGSVFITANTLATTITDFDTSLVDGKSITIIINDADTDDPDSLTTFDFTAAGLVGLTSDYLPKLGEVIQFVYSTVDNQWHVLAGGGGGGSGDITDVLDCSSGDCSTLKQAPIAFSANDLTPDVSAGSVFITANTTPVRTITDFDTDKSDGKIIWVIVDDAFTAFDFTGSGLSGNAADFTAVEDDIYQFMYSTTTTQWHLLGLPKILSDVTFTDWPVEIGIAVSDETTDLTTGTDKVTFRMPWAMTLTEIRANVATVATGTDLLTIDVNDSGTTVFSTELTIDASEFTSETAATPSVLSDTALADDAEITIDIELVGNTTAGKGLKIWLIGTRDI